MSRALKFILVSFCIVAVIGFTQCEFTVQPTSKSEVFILVQVLLGQLEDSVRVLVTSVDGTAKGTPASYSEDSQIEI